MSDAKPVVNLCDYIRDIPDFQAWHRIQGHHPLACQW